MNHRADRPSHLFVVFIFLTGSALAQNPAQQPVPLRTAGSISGLVTVDGKPKAGLVIELLTPATNGPRRVLAKATTNKTGRYVLTSIAPGTYDVSPSTPTLVVPNEGQSGQSGKSVTIEIGERVNGINFDLLSTGSVSGRVRDVSGGAVKGQTVELLGSGKDHYSYYSRPYYSSVPGEHITKDEGEYHISGVPPGRYIAKIGTAYGLATTGPASTLETYAQTFHPDANDAAKATVIEVGAGRETNDVDITVSGPLKTYSIAGRLVLVETGAPVPRVELEVTTTSENGMQSTRMSGAFNSDANGDFRIQGALPGHYVIAPDNDSALNTYGDPISFDVKDADVTGLRIAMHSASTLSGIVTIEGNLELPVADLLSKLWIGARPVSDQLMSASSSSTVTADGSFRIAGIRPGKAKLYTSIQRGAPMTVTLLRVERNGVEIQEGIEVRAGENVTGLRVVIGTGNGVLRGDVKIEGGLLEGANLYVLYRPTNSDPDSFYHADLDARRHFVIKGLMPGEYELMIGPMTVLISGEGGGRTASRMPTVKQTVVVGTGAAAEVSLVMTLRPILPEP